MLVEKVVQEISNISWLLSKDNILNLERISFTYTVYLSIYSTAIFQNHTRGPGLSNLQKSNVLSWIRVLVLAPSALFWSLTFDNYWEFLKGWHNYIGEPSKMKWPLMQNFNIIQSMWVFRKENAPLWFGGGRKINKINEKHMLNSWLGLLEVFNF